MTDKTRDVAHPLVISLPHYDVRLDLSLADPSMPAVFTNETGAWIEVLIDSEAESILEACERHLSGCERHDLREKFESEVTSEHKELKQKQATTRPKLYRDHIQPTKKLLQYLYSKKIFETIFQEIINDWAEDYYSALESGSENKARLERVRGYFSILCAIVTLTFVTPAKQLAKFWTLVG